MLNKSHIWYSCFHERQVTKQFLVKPSTQKAQQHLQERSCSSIKAVTVTTNCFTLVINYFTTCGAFWNGANQPSVKPKPVKQCLRCSRGREMVLEGWKVMHTYYYALHSILCGVEISSLKAGLEFVYTCWSYGTVTHCQQVQWRW